MMYWCYDAVVKRITITLPDELYENLRAEAFNGYTSISKLIIGKLTGETPSKFSGSVRGMPKTDSKGPIGEESQKSTASKAKLPERNKPPEALDKNKDLLFE